MIITISGHAGAGKTTVAKKLAKHLGYEFISLGKLWRGIAEACGLTLQELFRLAEKDSFYDKLIDDFQKRLAVGKDNLVVDSRLGWYFIPKSFKVFLTCSREVQGLRLFKRLETLTKKEAVVKASKRDSVDAKRYKEVYNIDIENPKNYDLIINTENLLPGEVVEKIVHELEKKKLL